MKLKSITTFFGVLAAGLFVLAQPVSADSVIGSKHDLTGAPYSLPGTACMYCHTSHMGPNGSAAAPLWDRTITGTTFTLYSGVDLNGTISQPDADGITRLCMSCHDGIIAFDNHGVDTTVMTGVNLVGTTLENDHPVSITFTTATATADGALNNPTTANIISGEIDGKTGTIQNNLLFNDKVECGSCHDVHDNANGYFMRFSNANANMCTNCHTGQDCRVCHTSGILKNTVAMDINPLTTGGSGTNGKHTAHYVDASPIVECNNCHNGYYPNAQHRDGTYNGKLEDSSGIVAMGGTWNSTSVTITSFVDLSQSAGTGVCNEASCHGAGSALDWYSTGTGCTACHTGGNAIDPLATSGVSQNDTGSFGKHDAHVNNQSIACETCHYGYKATSDHFNGTYTNADNTENTPAMVAFDPAVAGASAAWNNITDGCSNLATGCHGDVSDWYIAQSPCNICHDVLDPARPESKSHPRHFGNGNIADTSGPAAATGSPKFNYGDERVLGDLSGLTGYYTADNTISTADYMFGCGNCHPITAGKHNDGNIDVELYDVDSNANANSLKSKNTASAQFDQITTGNPTGTETCSNVYCHTSGHTSNASPAWGSGAMTHTFADPKCDNCHDNPPRYTGANTHLRDDTAGTYGYYREMGHFGTMNGSYVHGGGEVPMWGATSRGAAPITCQACHYGTLDAGNVIGTGLLYADTTGNYDMGSDGMPSCSFNSGAPNTACHNPSSATAGTYAVGGSLGAISTTDKRMHVNGKGDVNFDTRTSTPASLPGTYSGSGSAADVTAGPYWTQITVPFDMSTPPPGSAVSADIWSLNLSGAGYDPATRQCTNIPCHLRQTNGGIATYEPLSWSDALRCNVCHQM